MFLRHNLSYAVAAAAMLCISGQGSGLTNAVHLRTRLGLHMYGQQNAQWQSLQLDARPSQTLRGSRSTVAAEEKEKLPLYKAVVDARPFYRLGEGGFGVTYRAKLALAPESFWLSGAPASKDNSQIEVALKFVYKGRTPDEQEKRLIAFRHEVGILRSLSDKAGSLKFYGAAEAGRAQDPFEQNVNGEDGFENNLRLEFAKRSPRSQTKEEEVPTIRREITSGHRREQEVLPASDFHVIAMELVESTDSECEGVYYSNLSDVVYRKCNQSKLGLGMDMQAQIAAQIAETLHSAKVGGLAGDGHTAVANRDLKLENVLMHEAGPRVSVIDWGVSQTFYNQGPKPGASAGASASATRNKSVFDYGTSEDEIAEVHDENFGNRQSHSQARFVREDPYRSKQIAGTVNYSAPEVIMQGRYRNSKEKLQMGELHQLQPGKGENVEELRKILGSNERALKRSGAVIGNKNVGYKDAFKADVWSLGVMLYTMGTGMLPWHGEGTRGFRGVTPGEIAEETQLHELGFAAIDIKTAIKDKGVELERKKAERDELDQRHANLCGPDVYRPHFSCEEYYKNSGLEALEAREAALAAEINEIEKSLQRFFDIEWKVQQIPPNIKMELHAKLDNGRVVPKVDSGALFNWTLTGFTKEEAFMRHRLGDTEGEKRLAAHREAYTVSQMQRRQGRRYSITQSELQQLHASSPDDYNALMTSTNWSMTEALMRRDFPYDPESKIMSIDPYLRDLINRMLVFDPDQRISLEDVVAHPWVRKGAMLFGRSKAGKQQALARERGLIRMPEHPDSYESASPKLFTSFSDDAYFATPQFGHREESFDGPQQRSLADVMANALASPHSAPEDSERYVGFSSSTNGTVKTERHDDVDYGAPPASPVPVTLTTASTGQSPELVATGGGRSPRSSDPSSAPNSRRGSPVQESTPPLSFDFEKRLGLEDQHQVQAQKSVH